MCIQPITLYMICVYIYIYIIYVKKNWIDIDVCRCDLYGVRYIVSVVRHHNSPASCQRDAFISSRTITSESKSNLWKILQHHPVAFVQSVFHLRLEEGTSVMTTALKQQSIRIDSIIKCQPMSAAFEPHMHTGRQCPSSHRLWRWSTWYTQRHQRRGRGQQDKLSLKGFCKRTCKNEMKDSSRSPFFQIVCARLCPSLRMSVTKASGLLQPKGLMKLPRATTGSCRHTTGFQQMSRKKWDKILVTSHPLSWDSETLALNKNGCKETIRSQARNHQIRF